MKLIIDIDKKIYDRAMLGDFNITVFDEAVRNGIPLEEELEKIKAEVDKKYDELYVIDEFTNGEASAYVKILEIVNEHIAELKGEQK